MTAIAREQRLAFADVGRRHGKSRLRKAVLAASHTPIPCVILSVDTAKNSGVATYSLGRLVSSCELRKDDDAGLLAACVSARKLAELHGVQCVLVLEKPPRFVYRGRQASTMVGLGAAREAWERAWRDAGGIKARIVRVEPRTWRLAVLQTMAHHPTLEMGRALHIGKRDQRLRADRDYGADEAAAICIGEWATRAGEVLAAIPARLRGAA